MNISVVEGDGEMLSDESTEKFEIELANEQVKKIKQAINDCQLRFGKVMGCGTCKALQLCTWAKELSSTIESMGKYIEAQQQEIDRLKEKLNAVLQDFYQYVQGGKEICAFCLHDYECEPGETICGATYKGFKWRGLNEREDL